MKSVKDVYTSVWMQQNLLIKEIYEIVYSSGNMKGIPQWRDRKRLHQLMEKFMEQNYLLSKKDFQFLESLHFKYKV
tara:strand:- start:547 stop:774 length:228 start_codon:yes stop_codon:yes gene_type:complete